MHINWYNHAIKALIGQLGKQLYRNLDKGDRQHYLQCLNGIANEADLSAGAKCIIAARNRLLINRKNYAKWTKTNKQQFQVTKLVRTIMNGEEPNNNWSLSYNKLVELHKNMNAKRKLPGAKVYDLRLYDIVVGNDKPTKAHGKNMSFRDFLTMAFDLVDAFDGKTTKSDNWNVKILSPRIAPILPEKEDRRERRHLLSPSVLPFYNDESPDTIAPLPKVFEAMGMSERDRQAVLEMVMDISGAKQAVETSLDILRNMNFFGFEAEVFEATERLSKLFSSMEKSFNKVQNKEIEQNGYTFLEVEQIKKLFDGHGISFSFLYLFISFLKSLKNPSDVDFNLDEYAKLNRKQREEALWQRIERIASNRSTPHPRDKRHVISVLNPVVLAPYMFAPVVGISILGPVVLSPNVFSPLLLNPSLLSPFVLSPSVATPFILSPYLLSPYVMTPIFAAPFILSPYVLSPNVLNPYVLSPLILSPYVLCPDILSPQALGGPILSPSMFSPSVLTDSFLMASVLSPTFMS
uniref:ENTH domain-containing protein n=1 Tax=Ascaris lumbricoides TaxID=6252 RepID=A0A9J2Q0Y6_ASCLU